MIPMPNLAQLMKKACRLLPGLAMLPILPAGLFLAGNAGAAGRSDNSFYLKKGDYVCFYGDSITEQRYYGVDVEAYVRTRFPDLHVRFINSGVGGVQLKLEFDHDAGVQRASRSLVAALARQKKKIEHQQYVADQPQQTHYELVRVRS